MEAKEMNSWAWKRNTWAGSKDVAKDDGSSTRMSKLYEENPSSYQEVNEVCLEAKVHGHGADGKLMELAFTALAVESYVHIGV